MAVSSCTFYDDYIEHAIKDIFIFPDFITQKTADVVLF